MQALIARLQALNLGVKGTLSVAQMQPTATLENTEVLWEKVDLGRVPLKSGTL